MWIKSWLAGPKWFCGPFSFGGDDAESSQASAEDLKLARARAAEWKQFRRDYLYSQGNLANALHCSRRTVCAIENARESIYTRPALLRKFRDLKKRQERRNEPAVTAAYANVDNLFQKGA